MSRSPLSSLFFALAIVMWLCGSVLADAKADHAALSEAATKLSMSAGSVAKVARASDDRAARKKFAPAAQDLSDDLSAFARRAAKDVAFKTLTSDATALIKDATALVDLADEIEDKDERKALRGHATALAQGLERLGKQLIAAAAEEEKGGATKPAGDTAARRFTGLLVNNTDKCSWTKDVVFQVVRNGQAVFKTQNMGAGAKQALALEAGAYVIQILETGSHQLIAQKPFEAKAEGWTFVSGCVNDD